MVKGKTEKKATKAKPAKTQPKAVAKAKKGRGRAKKKRGNTFKLWQQALKLVGVGKVRKGTDEYDEVKKAFEKLKTEEKEAEE